MLITEELQDLQNKYEKYKTKFNELEKCLNEKNYDNFMDKCMILSHEMRKLSQKLSEVPGRYGIVKNDGSAMPTQIEVKKITVLKKDAAIKIILPELLPHRPHYDVVEKKMKYDYDLTGWKLSYMNAFEEAFGKKIEDTYKEKVMISFIHHQNKSKTDVDNFDIKAMIDIIALFMLEDDSKDQVCVFLNGVADDKDYTEIIIKPFR